MLRAYSLVRLVVVVAASFASVAGASAAQAATSSASLSNEVRRLIAAAKDRGERELNLSWGSTFGGAEGAKKFAALFSRIYGMDLKVSFTPGPSMTDMVGKVSLEVAAGQRASTDILLGTESHYGDLLGRNVLEEYDYAKLSEHITREVVAQSNIGVEIAGIVGGISYNTQAVRPNEAPRRLEDVLDPKWKGKIASTTNAAIFDRLAVRPEWGAEKMKAFVTRLSKQVAGLVRCQENNRIVSQEFLMMVLNCGSYQIRREKAKGAALGHVIPEDGGTIGFFHLGVPRNSGHPNLAKLYINVMMSPEGQKLIYEMEYTDHPALPGSQSAEELTRLKAKGAEVLKVDAKFVAENRDLSKLSDELRRILRQGQGS